MESFPVTIHDVRGQETSYSLDTHGFAFGRINTDESLIQKIREDAEGTHITKTYVEQVEEMLKQKTGASKVVVFDHLVRKQPKEVLPLGQEKLSNGPVQGVHIDQYVSMFW
jgi:hypothetical protein